MNTEGALKAHGRRDQQSANGWAYIRRAKADTRAKQIIEGFASDMRLGVGSYKTLARALVAAGIPAPRNGFWTALAVKRLLIRRLRSRELSEKRVLLSEATKITRRQNYSEFAETVRPHIRAAHAEGVMSLGGIARYLNRNKVRSHRGQLWCPSSVLYLREALKRAE